MMNRRLLALALALSGCAGHAASPFVPVAPESGGPALPAHAQADVPSMSAPLTNAGAKAPVTVSLAARRDELVDLSRVYRALKSKRGTAAFMRGNTTAYKSIEIDGEIWPSYAGLVPVTNVVTVAAPKGGVISVSETFQNVPVGNNEFAVFAIYGISSTGNKAFLGHLATFVNAGSSSPKVTATAKTTLAFQAAMSMIQAGYISARDLAKIPTLAAKVSTEIGTLGLKPDPTTGLFSDGTLLSFITKWKPAWQHQLEITLQASAQYFTLANDATNAAENTLFLNEGSFLAYNDFALLRPYGAPCKVTVPPHLPNKKPVVNAYSCYTSWYVYGNNNVPSMDVYGGPVLLGQITYGIPFTGSMQTLTPGSAPGLNAVALAPQATAWKLFHTNDPFDWAFDGTPTVDRVQSSGGALASPYANYSFSWGWQYPFNSTNNGVYMMTWNPWNLPLSAFQLCSFHNSCVAATSSDTLTIDPPFFDYGTDLSYFNWAGDGGTTVSADPSGGCTSNTGYNLSFSGTSFSMTTAPPHGTMWLAPHQQLAFYFWGSPCSPDPSGTTITVSAVGDDSLTYVNTGVNNGSPGSGILVTMNSVNRPTKISSITISGTVPNASPTTLDIRSMLYPNYGSVSAIASQGQTPARHGIAALPSGPRKVEKR